MSYVLDALKKADQDRHHSTSVSRDEVDELLCTAPRTESNSVAVVRIVNGIVWAGVFAILLVIGWYGMRLTDLNIQEKSSQSQTNSLSFEEPKIDQTNKSSSPMIANKLTNTVAEEPPNYNVTGYIFLGDGRSANKVFVDDQSYRIGNHLPDGYQVISITPQRMVVQKKGAKLNIEY